MTIGEAVQWIRNLHSTIGEIQYAGLWDYEQALAEIEEMLEQQIYRSDAVSKLDVLETFADLYDVFDDSPGIRKELDKIYDRLNKLPCVTEMRDKNE